MKIPFDIKYRPQIESGEYKVVCGELNFPVRIICWNARGVNGKRHIVALSSAKEDTAENILRYYEDGHLISDSACLGTKDLFIVTPEEELTEFEKRLFKIRHIAKRDMYSAQEWQTLRNESAELLALAREQFIKDGYVIVKKAFLDAVGKVDPEVMKEVSENVDKLSKEGLTEFEEAVKIWMSAAEDIVIDDSWVRNCAKELLFRALKQLQPEIDAEIEKAYKNADDVQYRKGKEDGIVEARNDISARIIALKQAKDRAEDALKDLPKWRKCDGLDTGQTTVVIGYTKDEDKLFRCGKVITLNDLEKLPGFKEDEK